MADKQNEKAPVPAPPAVAQQHDRVAMPSLKADGTPADFKPELIDTSDDVREGIREQHRQQAVSAADQELQRARAGAESGDVVDDPETAARRAEHEAAQAAGEQRADALVDALAPKEG